MVDDHDRYSKLSVPGWTDLGPLLGARRKDKLFVRLAERASDGEHAVLKHLPVGSTDKRAKRFFSEATETDRLRGTYGVLPVLDVDLAHGSSPRWYVTPRAAMLRDQTDKAEALQTVVEVVSALAGTMAGLGLRGIHHRDIKPDNLFWYDHAPALADFGIARWPGREGLTYDGEKVGPFAFIAPEMRDTRGGMNVTRADVYSLAKTLFVLAMRVRYPPDGTHRVDAQEFDLSRAWESTSHGALKALWHVLEAATAYRPADRLDMVEFRAELGHWLTLYPERIERRERRRLGLVGEGWGWMLGTYRRDMDALHSLLIRAARRMAEAYGVDADIRIVGEDGEKGQDEDAAPLLGPVPWPDNSPEGYEPEGYDGCSFVLPGMRVVLIGVLQSKEVSLVAEVHDGVDADGSGGRLSRQFGPTLWARPGLPSAGVRAFALADEVTAWLAGR